MEEGARTLVGVRMKLLVGNARALNPRRSTARMAKNTMIIDNLTRGGKLLDEVRNDMEVALYPGNERNWMNMWEQIQQKPNPVDSGVGSSVQTKAILVVR